MRPRDVQDFAKNPLDQDITGRRVGKWVFTIILILVPTTFLLWGVGWGCSVAAVVGEQLNPKTILERYEWFIETSNAVEEQDATLDAFKAQQGEVDVAKLSRRMQDDWALRQAEIRGVLANRNRIAREYRAAIQKINYVPATMLPHFPATIPSYKLN